MHKDRSGILYTKCMNLNPLTFMHPLTLTHSTGEGLASCAWNMACLSGSTSSSSSPPTIDTMAPPGRIAEPPPSPAPFDPGAVAGPPPPAPPAVTLEPAFGAAEGGWTRLRGVEAAGFPVRPGFGEDTSGSVVQVTLKWDKLLEGQCRKRRLAAMGAIGGRQHGSSDVWAT